MKFNLTIDGDLNALMRSEVTAGKLAVKSGLRDAAEMMKRGWRAEVEGAGLGAKLSRSIRSEVYPKGDTSLNAAALIWSKAPVIMYANEKGALIRSQNGFWLAIPTQSAGKGPGGRRITPGEWERRTGRALTFIYRRGKTALLVDTGRVNRPNYMTKAGEHKRRGPGRKNVTIPIFTLVPQVRLRKRLNVAELSEYVASRVPSMVVSRWRNA